MIRKKHVLGPRPDGQFSEKAMLKQRDEIMIRFNLIES